jgi:hypothetical protein
MDDVRRKVGDWNCEECGSHNFANRNACFKCRSPIPAAAIENNPARTRPGDWTCPHCLINNFASRTVCHKCSVPKPDGLGSDATTQRESGDGGVVKKGDWNCTCGNRNFSARRTCFVCGLGRKI